MGLRRTFLAAAQVASLSAAALASPNTNAQDARILYAEPIRGVAADRDVLMRKSGAAQLRELRFSALGRKFELDLDQNRVLDGALAKSASSLQLYRGAMRGAPGSWTRLAISGPTISGMIWDGANLFVVEPAEHVRGALNPPLTAAPGDTLIFKLSDVVIDSTTASCAVEAGEARKASDEYAALLKELGSSPVIMQAAGASVALQVSAVGDAQFVQRFDAPAKARDAILVRLNNVDGIFSSQLGVAIRASDVYVNEADSDPLSGDTAPSSLLQELAQLRERSPQLNSAGLSHLFTGRNLDGDTVGIAYVNTLCHKKAAVGLTEVRTFNAWRDSLIAAHEIGHNFGASHDGDAAGSCPATPSDTYLMAASVSGSDQFSQCSLSVMRPNAMAASCITDLPPSDISVPSELPFARQRVSQPFEWRLDATNVGGVSAPRARATIVVPPPLNVDDAYVVGGSCTSGGGVVVCELGDVPGGAARSVNLTLRSEVAGAFYVSARVEADADASLTNNTGAGEISIHPDLDLSVTATAPGSVRVGDGFELTFAVSNQGAIDARNVQVSIAKPSIVNASAATITGAACVLESTRVLCTLPSLVAGASASGAVSLIGASVGSASLTTRVSGDYYDPQTANDVAAPSVEITGDAAAEPTAAAQQQKSGGGALSPALLLALLSLGMLRGRRAPAA